MGDTGGDTNSKEVTQRRTGENGKWKEAAVDAA